MPLALYNEIDGFACEWLRNLEKAGHIAAGVVRETDIKSLAASDVSNFSQCHFFAGIGVWSYALRLAGWPDELPVWTGSCPCQPFSAAGRRQGEADSRHLWPAWFSLIDECRPPVIFGEQVASPAGLNWFDSVCADLENAGYAVGAADLCAASIGAPHIRQRLYFCAINLADATGFGHQWSRLVRLRRNGLEDNSSAGGGTFLHSGMGHPDNTRLQRHRQPSQFDATPERQGPKRHSTAASFWSDVEWLNCRDGKMRPAKPGIFPLADGTSGRVGKLRAYGNAIVPQVAATFIRAVMDLLDGGAGA